MTEELPLDNACHGGVYSTDTTLSPGSELTEELATDEGEVSVSDIDDRTLDSPDVLPYTSNTRKCLTNMLRNISNQLSK